MLAYECMLILKGDLEEQEVDEMAEAVKGMIKKEGGSIALLEKIGKKRLAYRVNNNRYGNYLLTYFEAEPEKMKNLEWSFKLAENILKSMTIRITKEELDEAAAGTKTTKVIENLEAVAAK